MIKGTSLFCNVGIAETYLKKYDIDIVVANELLEDRAKFYRFCYPDTDVVTGDITDDEIFNLVVKKSKEHGVEFLLATPPCQGMSVAGKMDEHDPRNSLIIKVVDFIKEVKPKNVIIENVPTMLKTSILINNEKIKIVDYINRELGNDYKISFNILNAANYGTPQTRNRTIVLMSKLGDWKLPEMQRQITVREAIGWLPSLESGQKSDIKYHFAPRHNERHILWMKHTPTGKSAFNNKIYFPQKEDGTRIKGFSTTYKRMSWDKPAPTITMCNGGISSQNNVHPGRPLKDGTYSDARVLSLKELMILTGLPDDWEIPEWASENLVRKVIGEGVPPKLIEAIIKNMPRNDEV
ncbi:MAG: DNA cytosine methyltransferase [Bacilli bacterium]